AAAGTVVTITANAPEAGKVFDKWECTPSGEVSFADENAPVTTFVMPEDAVSITATYKNKYTISITDGRATPYSAAAGTVVTISASIPPSGQVFYKWKCTPSGVVSFADENAPVTTFVMPEGAFSITATYKPALSIRVENGTATIDNIEVTSGAAEDTVTVTASALPMKQFDKWVATTSGVTFGDANSPSTTFTMPNKNVSVKATYIDL
ncbi:MAG: hypothetical protein K5930_12265, partial [Treponemataceae bacterium]|nr:hypothetical protein [Treponemataceae bacterium]